LGERHTRLEKEIRVYEEKLSNEEVQRAEAMARLQGKWRNATEATNECSFAAQEAQRMIERIAGHVQSFFFKIQCDQSLNDAAKENRSLGKPKRDALGKFILCCQPQASHSLISSHMQN